ncbi:MAG: phosphodiester glycosidase family protein, partial [Armatimonadetes bacterium]|nr:phosphodiester glycosidase family protein [Armatimonadota bacterium]
AARADPARVEGRGVACGEHWLTAAEAARDYAALAAINGGYFDDQHHALGLVISDSKQVNPVRRADWGVFLLRRGRAEVVHTRDLKNTRDVTQALQCGPRLVVDGRLTKLKPSPATARSAVGVDAEGRVVLVVTRGALRLSEFARLLARAEKDHGLGCRDALNLDGGPSTQFAVPGQVDLPGGWPMPTFLLFRARATP